MVIEPLFERAVLFLDSLDLFCIFNRRIDLKPVADDAGVGQQAIFLALAITGYLVDVEVIEGLEEVILFLQNGRPGKTGLVDLEDQSGEQVVVVLYREAVFVIMIMNMNIALFEGLYEGAITGQFFHVG